MSHVSPMSNCAQQLLPPPSLRGTSAVVYCGYCVVGLPLLMVCDLVWCSCGESTRLYFGVFYFAGNSSDYISE
jgi:hypothetical protein